MHVLAEVRGHVGVQVAEAVQRSQGEVKGEAPDQAQDAVDSFRSEYSGPADGEQIRIRHDCWIFWHLFFLARQWVSVVNGFLSEVFKLHSEN